MLEFLLWLYVICALTMVVAIVVDWPNFKEDVLDGLQAKHPNSTWYYAPIVVAVLAAPVVFVAALVKAFSELR